MKVQRSLVAFLIFFISLYVIPGRFLLRFLTTALYDIVPIPSLSSVPPFMVMPLLGIDGLYLAGLIVAYIVAYLFVVAWLWLLRVYRWYNVIRWLERLSDRRGVEKLDRFLAQILPFILILVTPTIIFWDTEGTVGLLLAAWVGFLGMMTAPRVPKRPPPLPQPVTPLPEPDEEVPDGDVTKTYRWKFPSRLPMKTALQDLQFQVTLKINSKRYQEFRREDRISNPRQWYKYAIADAPEVDVLASKLLRLGHEQKFRSLEIASNTLAFTQQCIEYAYDVDERGELTEYPKYPVETLMDEQGDCEDQSILTAALLKRMGYDVILLLCPGHMALGIAGAEGLPGEYIPYRGTRYFYAETTGEGWMIGEVPESMRPYIGTDACEPVPVVKEIGE